MASPTEEDSGIERLRGSTYSYGTHDQVARFTKTTKDIAEYTSTTFKYGKEMWTLIQDKAETVFTEPTEVEKAATWSQMEKYKMLLRMWIDNEKAYKRDKAKVFRIIMSQCLPAMKNNKL